MAGKELKCYIRKEEKKKGGRVVIDMYSLVAVKRANRVALIVG